jgi:hypothetical protein
VRELRSERFILGGRGKVNAENGAEFDSGTEGNCCEKQ